jgi:hypothetical protein
MAIAFFSTWTTYGTWLPGDQRGWYRAGRGLQEPDAMRRLEAALLMTESALTLDAEQRRVVEKTIADHCMIRKWTLRGVNCRSNHVHVAVTAPGRDIEVPRAVQGLVHAQAEGARTVARIETARRVVDRARLG